MYECGFKSDAIKTTTEVNNKCIMQVCAFTAHYNVYTLESILRYMHHAHVVIKSSRGSRLTNITIAVIY